MTSYELHLLGLAVEASQESSFITWQSDFDSRWVAFVGAISGQGSTRVEALTNLLTDLGVEVPERPSAEEIAKSRRGLPSSLPLAWTYLQRIRATKPLLMEALLEGGAS